MSDGEYGGLLGAFPYAFRASESLLFRSYVVVGGLVAAFVGLVFLLALPGWIAATLGGSVSVTVSRAFLVVVGLSVVAPLVAPVLLAARRHRLVGDPADRYDAALAATGYLFVGSVYVGLVTAAPAGSRDTPPAVVAPLVNVLYGLAPIFGVVPPLVAVAAMVLVHRRLG